MTQLLTQQQLIKGVCITRPARQAPSGGFMYPAIDIAVVSGEYDSLTNKIGIFEYNRSYDKFEIRHCWAVTPQGELIWSRSAAVLAAKDFSKLFYRNKIYWAKYSPDWVDPYEFSVI